MIASRTQHLLASAMILLIALSVAWLSFKREPADAFIFPRLISSFFAFFAAWNFARAVCGMSKVGEGLDMETVFRFLPGLAVTLIYFFWAAKALGFYASSCLTFYIIYTLYDPVPLANPLYWMKRLLVTLFFMTVIFGLFTELLQVQTPRGLYDGNIMPVFQAIIQPLRYVIALLTTAFIEPI